MNQHQGHEYHVPNPESDHPTSSDYAPYPKLDPDDVAPPKEDWATVNKGSQSPPPAPQPLGSPTPDSAAEGPAPISGRSATTMPVDSNPYISSSPAPASSMKSEYLTVGCFFLAKFLFPRVLM